MKKVKNLICKLMLTAVAGMIIVTTSGIVVAVQATTVESGIQPFGFERPIDCEDD